MKSSLLTAILITAFTHFPLNANAAGNTADPVFVTPAIEGYGKMVRLPDAAVQPEKGAKVVLDISSDKKEGPVLKALEHAAIMFNLYADAEAPLKMTIVLHGGATMAVLSDEAFAKRENGAKNPNLDLLRKLKAKGVELFVCGQALAHQKIAVAEVAPEVTVAVAAATVTIGRQNAGYAYLPFH